MPEIWIQLTIFFFSICLTYGKPQHIIFILADDLGYNDVSFHGSNEIPTPNIDALCYGGIILKNHYVLPMCTPSRTALMTGKYPIHLGMQHDVLMGNEPRGLPLTEKLLPQYLKDFNYINRIVGKWHLGFHKRKYTPLLRGFDTHYGYMSGYQDYYDHTALSTFLGFRGLDMRRNWACEWSTIGSYSTDLYTKESIDIIQNHDASRPLFLYLSHLAPHAGNYYAPLQAPLTRVEKFSHIKNNERRTYAAMVSELDGSVGAVIEALAKKGMLAESIVVFLSDNGAPVKGMHANHGSNWPLRGQKRTPFEGSVRTPACVWSKRFHNNQRVSSQLMHIADWLPTLYSAAGGNVSRLGQIDGIDMWQALSSGEKSPREEVLINIDEKIPYAALRVGNLKFVIGTPSDGQFDKWFEPEDMDNRRPYNTRDVYESKVAKALADVGSLLQEHILDLRLQSQLQCDSKSKRQCDPLSAPCLFDLEKDPCERNNIYGVHPASKMMDEKMRQYAAKLVPASNVDLDPKSNPIFWNYTWTFWNDIN